MTTLEQIEGDIWPEAPDETTLMRKCRLLRAKDLNDFTAEDYRLLVGQGISLAVLAPRVLALLKHDLLIQGDLYRGDVLSALLRPGNWLALKSFETQLVPLCEGALKAIALEQEEPSLVALCATVHDYLNTTGK